MTILSCAYFTLLDLTFPLSNELLNTLHNICKDMEFFQHINTL